MITVSSVSIFTLGLAVGDAAGYGVPFLCKKYRKTDKRTTPGEKETPEKHVDKIFREAVPLFHPDAAAIDAPAADITANATKTDKPQIVLPESPMPEEAASSAPPPPVQNEPATLTTAKLRAHANSAEEENLKMLLLDRLDEIEEEEADICQQAMCAVLLIDELRQMQGAYTGQNAQCIKDMLYALQEELTAHECEILNSDTWNPEIQKIGKVEYTLPNDATPVITAKLASGLRLKGRIIKKQIVALNKSSL